MCGMSRDKPKKKLFLKKERKQIPIREIARGTTDFLPVQKAATQIMFNDALYICINK